MARLRVIHWKASEAAECLALLRSLKHEVEYEEAWRPALLREWRGAPPDGFIIDLSRLPSHGKEIGIALRRSPATRLIPIVFNGGTEEKVRTIREQLPDAVYTNMAGLKGALASALREKPAQVAVPTDKNLYGTRTAAQKLGIRQGSKVGIVQAPRSALALLGELPAEVEVVEGHTAGDVVLCFLHNAESVGEVISEVRSSARRSKLWLLWQKKSSPRHSGVTEQLVRDQAIELGLVDYKICSVSEDWTAMLFALRKG